MAGAEWQGTAQGGGAAGTCRVGWLHFDLSEVGDF